MEESCEIECRIAKDLIIYLFSYFYNQLIRFVRSHSGNYF